MDRHLFPHLLASLRRDLSVAGDTINADMLKRAIEHHELDAADRKRALDERISALPKQVLS